MKNLAAVLSRYSKFIAAIVGAVTEAVNLGYIPHVAQNYVSVAVSILTALGVVGVSNGPALADGTAIANDVASLKEQIGPLPPKGGLMSITKHLAQIAEQHGKNLEAIVEAGKASIEDLIHHPTVSVAKPTTAGTPIAFTVVGDDPTAREAIANIGQAAAALSPEAEAPTPAAEPQSETQSGDALAELATLVP